MAGLAPQRYFGDEFFLADILDASSKSDLASMEHPIFSLSKSPDMNTRHYQHGEVTVDVTPSVKGLATIWDKDILIYCCSQLREGLNRGRPPSPIVHFVGHDFFRATNRSKPGGNDYRHLKDALDRLAGTRVQTNIPTGGSIERDNFGLLMRYRINENEESGMMESITIELPQWLYRSVVSAQVLTLHRDYFRLRGGLDRRLYELARKHCGRQPSWSISLDALYSKTGVRSPMRRFRFEINKLERGGHLPSYHVTYDRDADRVTFWNQTVPEYGPNMLAQQLELLSR